MNLSKNSLGRIITLVLVSGVASASQVAELTTFTAGSPARAAEVNANFTALRNAVNDADARVTAIEGGKQNRITGECQPGMAVTGIGADGSVKCVEWRRREEILKLSVPTLQPFSTNSCVFDFQTRSFSGSHTNFCRLVAQVHLPHGAEVTGIACDVRDNMPGTQRLVATLGRGDMTIFTTGASVGNGGAGETISAATGQDPHRIIDNELFYYILNVWYRADGMTFDDIGHNLSVNSCGVTYRQ